MGVSPKGAGRGGRDRRIAAYTALLLLGGVVSGGAAQKIAGTGGPQSWGQAPLVLAVLALASHLIIRIQCGDEIEALDLFEAVLAPTIVVFPALLAVGLATTAKALVGALHRNEPVKARFNAAQWAAATGAGTLVYAALADGRALSPRNIAALALAMLVVAAVNHGAVTVVIAMATGRKVGEVLAGLRPVILLAWVGGSAVNVAFGLLFVSAYLHTPYAVVVMVVPLVVLHGGSRGFATARTDRVRLTGLQSATHALAGPVDPRDAIPGFLTEVVRCFEADAVDLYLLTPNGPVRHRVAGELPYACYLDADGTSTAARLAALAGERSAMIDAKRDPMGLLADEGWRAAAVAPVRAGDRGLGVLCVYNRGGAEGFEHGEVVVLEALAGEVAGALVKAELLEGMLEERRQLADIVGHTSDGILTLDARGAVTSWNAAMEQITGHEAYAMNGRGPDGVLRPRDDEGAPVAFEQWLGRSGSLPNGVEIVTADQQSRWLSCSYTELPPRDGRGPQLVVMARDVTKVHELDKMKDDFVAHVSHELRTPLAPIKGWATTLLTRAEELSAEQRTEGVRAILRQAGRLEQLILNILEDSKVEHDAAPGSADDVVDVSAVVAKVVGEYAIIAPERAVEVSGADLPALVSGREVRIEQVLTNLLGNAVKYAPKNQPIEVRILREAGAVVIDVADRGPGIPPESRERIFQRFERLADSPTQSGTGLGLYISRHLATTMGAELHVSARPGGGSVFSLRLRSVRALAAVG
jgi:PAS domain S-box-containing protein